MKYKYELCTRKCFTSLMNSQSLWKTYTEEIMSICYIVLFKFNYYFGDSFEISAFVPQGSGSGSMFVPSLRGDPFRVSSAFYYWNAYIETSFSKCVVYYYFRFFHFICFKHRVDVLDMLMDDYFPFFAYFYWEVALWDFSLPILLLPWIVLHHDILE